MKAVVLGAAGGIGQPLSLLLKCNPLVTELALYDIVAAVGVAADLSHIATPAQVKGYPKDGLEETLKGAEIVVIPAGIPRKPGMTRDDLFKINAGIVRDLSKQIAQTCPKAFILIISNPVNSTVPIVKEVLKQAGVFDAQKLFGVTTLDIVRASTFIAQAAGEAGKASEYKIPVVGGHSGATIVPLLSQSKPALPKKVLDDKEALGGLVNRIQFGGDEVVKAKDGAGSATLSMAFAGAQFADFIIKAAKGEKGIVVQSFVALEADKEGGAGVAKEIGKELEFFSVNVELGKNGVEKILPIGDITETEKELIKACVAELEGGIAKGSAFVTSPAL